MRIKNYFILLLCFWLVSCSAQKKMSLAKDASEFKIDLKTVYEAPGRGVMILYPLSGMEDSLKKKIKFPNLSKVKDTSFAQIYFTGINNGAIENSILVLVGNYSYESPLFWIDDDNDLDFSEVKKPILFSESFMEATIADIEQKQLVHNIRFHKLDSIKIAEKKVVIEKYITKGNKYHTFYMDERRNILVGDFIYQQDSLRIGLIDWNVNGSYSDLGKDRLVFGKYGGKINGTEESEGAIILDSITYFQGKTFAFEVTEVSQTGSSLKIKPTVNENVKDRISNGKTISDYSFQSLTDEKLSIYKFLNNKRYIYLNFWATWCVGCHTEINDLKKIDSLYSDKITMISLNYNENKEKVKSFMEKYEIKWLNGFSNTLINDELFIHGLPRNILIDPTGKIVEMNIHPSKLLNRIDEFKN